MEIGEIVIGFEIGREVRLPSPIRVFRERFFEELQAIGALRQNQVATTLSFRQPGQARVVSVAGDLLPRLRVATVQAGQRNRLPFPQVAGGILPRCPPRHRLKDIGRGDAGCAERAGFSGFGDEVVSYVVGPPGVVRSGVTQAAQHMKFSRADADLPVAVNDPPGVESGQTGELTEALDLADQQTADGAMASNRAESRPAGFEQARSTGVDELPSHGIKGWVLKESCREQLDSGPRAWARRRRAD